MTDPVTRYLRELETRLHVWPWQRERIIREVDRHLADLTAEEQRHGVPRGEGQRRAIDQFGTVDEIVTSFQRAAPAYHRVIRYGITTAAMTIAVSVVGGVAALAALGFGEDGQPPVAAPPPTVTEVLGSDDGLESRNLEELLDNPAELAIPPDSGATTEEEAIAIAFAPIEAFENMSIFGRGQDTAAVTSATKIIDSGAVESAGRILLGNVGPDGESIVAYPTSTGEVAWGLADATKRVATFTAQTPAPFARVGKLVAGVIPDQVTNVVAVQNGAHRAAIVGHNAFAVDLGTGDSSATLDAVLLGLQDGRTLVVPIDCSLADGSCPEPRPLDDLWAWGSSIPGTPIEPARTTHPGGLHGPLSQLDPVTAHRVVEAGLDTDEPLTIVAGRNAGDGGLCFAALALSDLLHIACLTKQAQDESSFDLDGPLAFVTSSDGGTIAGLVRTDVVRVAAVLANGTERDVRLNRHRGFGYAPAKPARRALTLRAYGETGALLGEMSLSPAEPWCAHRDSTCFQEQGPGRGLAGAPGPG